MPLVKGIGDEVLIYALFALGPILIVGQPILRSSLPLLKRCIRSLRAFFRNAWLRLRGRSDREHVAPTQSMGQARATRGGGLLQDADLPPPDEMCSICHDQFTMPCQANCSHWFCGECILRAWQHSSALSPCRCPICRGNINLLLLSRHWRIDGAEQERIASDIAKYNRLFGGVPVSFVQRLRDAPLLLRRMVGELLDPGRSLALLHNIRILFCLLLLVTYLVSPFDIIPESILGLVGFIDDIVFAAFVGFYLSILYRATLLNNHT
eukprot:TRINITY_DN16255_c0_g1_i1.p1 TRINITY_DN16255_c0_g1~~TRINITY_DN16255_c0_g1_i1.p1  ORF type:complete len:266 (+),score=33.98 TRINITY_DN16255_c0_g1_i1:557-1354(+)